MTFIEKPFRRGSYEIPEYKETLLLKQIANRDVIN